MAKLAISFLYALQKLKLGRCCSRILIVRVTDTLQMPKNKSKRKQRHRSNYIFYYYHYLLDISIFNDVSKKAKEQSKYIRTYCNICLLMLVYTAVYTKYYRNVQNLIITKKLKRKLCVRFQPFHKLGIQRK